MAITPTDAILRVQDNTGRPSTDQQCPAAVIARRLDTEYKNLHRRVSDEFPTFYEKTILANVGAGVAGSVTLTVTLTGTIFSDLDDPDRTGSTYGFGIVFTLDDASTVTFSGLGDSVAFTDSGSNVTTYEGTASTFSLVVPSPIPAGRAIASVAVTVTMIAQATALTAATLTLKRTGGAAAELGSYSLMTLGTTVSSGFALYADVNYYGANWIGEPADFESLRLLERLTGNGQWMPVASSSSLNRRESLNISFYEQGRFLMLSPDSEAPGQYRLTYESRVPETYTYYDLPAGFEQIIIEEASAFVRQRHEEDPTYHKREGQRIWDDQYMSLWNRFGSHGRSGLNITRE